MSNVRADWQPVFLWPLPTDSSLPLSHSHQPIPIPTDLPPLPPSPLAFSAPSFLLQEGRRVIPSSPFLSTSSFSPRPFLPPPLLSSLFHPVILSFGGKANAGCYATDIANFPLLSAKKLGSEFTYAHTHTHTHALCHGDTGDTYLFCIQSDTHSLSRSNA